MVKEQPIPQDLPTLLHIPSNSPNDLIERLHSDNSLTNLPGSFPNKNNQILNNNPVQDVHVQNNVQNHLQKPKKFNLLDPYYQNLLKEQGVVPRLGNNNYNQNSNSRHNRNYHNPNLSIYNTNNQNYNNIYNQIPKDGYYFCNYCQKVFKINNEQALLTHIESRSHISVKKSYDYRNEIENTSNVRKRHKANWKKYKLEHFQSALIGQDNDRQLMSDQDLQIRESRFLEIRKLLLDKFPSLSVFLYGSSITGVGFNDSDVNVWIDGKVVDQNTTSENGNNGHNKPEKQVLCYLGQVFLGLISGFRCVISGFR